MQQGARTRQQQITHISLPKAIMQADNDGRLGLSGKRHNKHSPKQKKDSSPKDVNHAFTTNNTKTVV